MNTVCHIEFDVTDMDRAQAFYQSLFGWEFTDFMGGDMRIFGTGEDHIGGLLKKPSVSASLSPSVWIKVASLNATLEKTGPAGGSVAEQPSPVPGVGFSAVVLDPDGNRVGLVEYSS